MNTFAEACKASYYDREAAILDIDSLPEPQYSENHLKRMEKLFDQMRGDRYHHFTRKTARLLLVAAIVFALILCAFAVPASREFFAERYEEFSRFFLIESNGNAVRSIEIGYIPEDFAPIEEHNNRHLMEYKYQSESGDILTVSKNSSDITSMFNSEGGTVEEITEDGITYSLITNSSSKSTLLWVKNDYIYSVEGMVSSEEMLKIAQNLK